MNSFLVSITFHVSKTTVLKVSMSTSSYSSNITISMAFSSTLTMGASYFNLNAIQRITGKNIKSQISHQVSNNKQAATFPRPHSTTTI